MVKRSEKLAFMAVGTEKTYTRMTGFTELTVSKNPKEYTRKYVDEDAERSSVVAYAPSMSYKYDYEPENTVHQEFQRISDNEIVGEGTICDIVIVDLTQEDGANFKAIRRNYAIIPSSEGDDADTMTASGTLKAYGEIEVGIATTDDAWKTLTFTPAE